MPGIAVSNSMWTKLTLSLNMTPSELKLFLFFFREFMNHI